MLFLAGDLTQWHLPVGMKKLDLSGCSHCTGTLPDSEKAKVGKYTAPGEEVEE
jgi:hypothetical protein